MKGRKEYGNSREQTSFGCRWMRLLKHKMLGCTVVRRRTRFSLTDMSSRSITSKSKEQWAERRSNPHLFHEFGRVSVTELELELPVFVGVDR